MLFPNGGRSCDVIRTKAEDSAIFCIITRCITAVERYSDDRLTLSQHFYINSSIKVQFERMGVA